MRYYPIFVDLQGKPAVVVGGGHIAERKVRTLLECGACVTLIAPEGTPGIADLADRGTICWRRRAYQDGDLDGAFCTYAATNDNPVNVAVYNEAERRRQLCNVVDVPPLCNFIVPSIVNRGDLLVAVSTAGNSPALAKRLRADLETEIGPEYQALNDLLGRLRPEVKRRYPEEAPRNDVLDRMLSAGVLDLLREGRAGEAEELAWKCL
ncbi:MAG TPA: bifunctional precorrin-2 dehydrogenase/sirohydrochlorin ferrochelatase [Armatimonadota bacterium]|jgi:precorrin-2 dehydrogenase/sirohydrochlorin ferrochelatase